jgi:hypothetical protein
LSCDPDISTPLTQQTHSKGHCQNGNGCDFRKCDNDRFKHSSRSTCVNNHDYGQCDSDATRHMAGSCESGSASEETSI